MTWWDQGAADHEFPMGASDSGAFYVGLLDGLLGVAGMIITGDYGSFPKIPY
jgi:hypothetical protein